VFGITAPELTPDSLERFVKLRDQNRTGLYVTYFGAGRTIESDAPVIMVDFDLRPAPISELPGMTYRNLVRPLYSADSFQCIAYKADFGFQLCEVVYVLKLTPTTGSEILARWLAS
jgi:hypothetical protein